MSKRLTLTAVAVGRTDADALHVADGSVAFRATAWGAEEAHDEAEPEVEIPGGIHD